jgi:5'-3' exonuclease
MDYLSKFLDFYIKKRVTEQQGPWKGLEVIFSNEKVVGEGEWKLMQWIRNFYEKNPTESNCICGMDADLIMLALASGTKNLSILREEPQDRFFGYYFIDIDSTMNTLASEMNWRDGKVFNPQTAMLDFMFICYTIGNDFLPKVETVDVTLGSIDTMLEIYKKVCREHGHLIKQRPEEKGGSKNRLKKRAVSAFFTELGKSEQEVMTEKLKKKGNFFEDPLLNTYGVYETESSESKILDFDIRGYRRAYYSEKLNIKDRESIQKMVFEYLNGMQFVLEYYTSDTVPSWTWKYPYHYAPFSYDIGRYCTKLIRTDFEVGVPYPPFLQLMSILPEASSSLLPTPLAGVMNDELKEYYPKEFKVDYSGKSREYEGVVLLPILTGTELENVYRDRIEFVSDVERRRNTVGKTFIYTPSRPVVGKPVVGTPIKCMYGQIKSTAKVRMV